MIAKQLIEILQELPDEYTHCIADLIREQDDKYRTALYREKIAKAVAEEIPFLTSECYNRPYTCSRYADKEDIMEGDCLDFITVRSHSLLDCFVDIYEFLEMTGLEIKCRYEEKDPKDVNWKMYLFLDDNTFILILPH